MGYGNNGNEFDRIVWRLENALKAKHERAFSSSYRHRHEHRKASYEWKQFAIVTSLSNNIEIYHADDRSRSQNLVF